MGSLFYALKYGLNNRVNDNKQEEQPHRKGQLAPFDAFTLF